MGGHDDSDEEEEGSGLPSLADALRLLRNRARTLALFTVLGLTVAVALVLVLPPQYVATATVLIDPREKRIANMQQVTSELVANTPAMESEVEIFYSRDIASRVFTALSLENDPELGELNFPWSVLRSLKRAIIGPPPQVAAAPSTDGFVLTDELLDRFNDRITAGRVGESYLIGVSYRSKSPEKAVAIADALAAAYVQQQIDAKVAEARKATAVLENGATVLRQQVIDAEAAVDRFKTENGLVDSEGQLLDEKQAARHMEKLVAARAATADARAKLQQIERFAQTPEGAESISAVIDKHTISLLKDQLARAAQSAAELETKYGSLHPSLIKARAQVDELRRQVADEVRRILADERSRYAVAVENEQELEAGLQQIKERIGQSSAAVVKLRQLEREAKALREVYESMLKRAQETARQVEIQIADARIVNKAAMPSFASSPKRLVILLSGLFGGLMAGLSAAVFLELRSPSFVRSEQIESSFKVRHLATAEQLDEAGGDLSLPPSLRQMRRILSEPQSRFAEAIRNIRLAIERGRKRGGPQVVLIASAMSGEGKTMIASNLALHYALSGVRTTLVDADIRQAGLTRELLPDPELSLSDCIMTRRPVRDAVLREMLTGLNFLPATGSEPPAVSAAELLASPPMAAILAQLKQEFEIIILDTPPVIPVVDAALLADLADQIVFVTRWKATPKSVVKRALGKLSGSMHKLTGIVVNGVAEQELGTLQVFEAGDYKQDAHPKNPARAA